MGGELELRAVGAEEHDAFVAALFAAFHGEPRAEDTEIDARLFEPERNLAVLDGGRIVATTGAFTRELTVPGGPVPAACVTMVGVQPTHRRRGLLTRMMRRQLDEVHAAGREPVAALWASEGVIYQRFGYGLASRCASLSLATHTARLRDGAPVPAAPARLLAPAEARADLGAVYDAVRPVRAGLLDRSEAWWDRRVHDPEPKRDGAGPLRAVVQDGPDGAAAGYALYAVKAKMGAEGIDGEVVVRELMAADPQAAAGVWGYLLDLDLTRRLSWMLGPADEPLRHLLADEESLRSTLLDSLWVRLVDVGAALVARAYAAPVDVVLEVDDAFCPWNAGRWRLSADASGASCGRTGDRADLSLGATELGAVHLGGTTLAALGAAGRVDEVRPGALTAASLAWRGAREPWCPEIF